mmetsp:Transcript_7250/g.10713  ORF Transcript_7250/g.10713 Transcript_7250/m.10713 type:complete len:494 (-) Transcript_7250:31-1512(-)
MGSCTSKKAAKEATTNEENKDPVIKRTFGSRKPVHESTSQQNILEFYTLEKVLGSGHFGNVRRAHPKSNRNQKVAIKSIDKRKLKKAKDQQMLKRELEILQTVDHPNIIKLYESFEDPKYLHIVMELCSGGELFERIVEKGRYTEKEASIIMRSILRAVNHLHKNGIAHRDLKPENFLFLSRNEDSELKLVDFGLSNKFGDKFGERMQSMVGTPYYVAPEVLQGRYGPECDLWSSGVIMYVILSGTLPFPGQSHSEIFNKIIRGEVKMDGRVWTSVGPYARDLIKKLMVYEPKSRLSAEEALNHPWFKEAKSANQITIDFNILESLQNYKATSRFQKEALSVVVKHLSYESIQDLKNAFFEFDTSNTGYLSLEEVQAALEKAGFNIAGNKVREIIGNVDYKGDGRINYSEFIAATLSSKMDLNEQIMWNAFNHFDLDNTGYVTEDNLKSALLKTGKSLEPEQIQEMIKEVDQENNGKVSFDEFKAMLMGGTKL